LIDQFILGETSIENEQSGEVEFLINLFISISLFIYFQKKKKKNRYLYLEKNQKLQNYQPMIFIHYLYGSNS